MMGDYNAVSDPKIDKAPVKKGGRLPDMFFDIVRQEGLEDVWRHWNRGVKDYMYYSASGRSWPRKDNLGIQIIVVDQKKSGYFPQIFV